jgi:hypothetical protein
MKNISEIKLNQLMENLYLESAVNRIYEEAADFDWIGDYTTQIKADELRVGDVFRWQLNHNVWTGTEPDWAEEFNDKIFKVVKLDRTPSGRKIIHYIQSNENGDTPQWWVGRRVMSGYPNTSLFSDEGVFLNLIKRGATVPQLGHTYHLGKLAIFVRGLTESTDFEWIKETQPFDLDECNWVIRVDNEFEWAELEMYLFNNGWGWYGEEPEYYSDGTIEYEPKFNHFFADECVYKTFDSSSLQLVKKRMPNHNIYKWSKLKPLIQGNLNESEKEKEDSSLKEILADLKIAPKFLFTFGTGIGGFLGPVTKLLEGSGIHLSQVDIGLLIITSIAFIIQDTDYKKLKEELVRRDIFKHLGSVTQFINGTQKVINGVLKKVTGASYGLMDILGFTFIMVPVTKILTDLIGEYGITVDSVGQLLTGLAAGTLSYGVKSIINKIRKKL